MLSAMNTVYIIKYSYHISILYISNFHMYMSKIMNKKQFSMLGNNKKLFTIFLINFDHIFIRNYANFEAPCSFLNIQLTSNHVRLKIKNCIIFTVKDKHINHKSFLFRSFCSLLLSCFFNESMFPLSKVA